MHDMLIKYIYIYIYFIYAKKIKSKKNKNALYMIVSMYSRRCESYKIYLKGDSPYQTVMIVCELK